MFLTGPLSEKYGEVRMLAIGMALTVVGAGLQVLSPGTTATIALMCVTAVGQSVAFPNVASLITRTADPHRQGQILGLNNACGALARVVGPFCAGLIFPININGPFLMGAIVVIPAIFLAISASRRATKLQV
jgi:MFS family permease